MVYGKISSSMVGVRVGVKVIVGMREGVPVGEAAWAAVSVGAKGAGAGWQAARIIKTSAAVLWTSEACRRAEVWMNRQARCFMRGLYQI